LATTVGEVTQFMFYFGKANIKISTNFDFQQQKSRSTFKVIVQGS